MLLAVFMTLISLLRPSSIWRSVSNRNFFVVGGRLYWWAVDVDDTKTKQVRIRDK